MLWNVNVFLNQSRLTIYTYVLQRKNLILYRFLSFVSMHYHWLEYHLNVKADVACQIQEIFWSYKKDG